MLVKIIMKILVKVSDNMKLLNQSSFLLHKITLTQSDSHLMDKDMLIL